MKRHKTYIWQHSDWPNFKWNNDIIIGQLSNLAQLLGILNGKMSMIGFGEKSESILDALTKDLINSSEIEGIALNPTSVRSSIAKKLGIEDGTTLATDHYIEGLVDVMFDAITNCRTPLTSTRLFNWHAALFPTGRSGMYPITVADWRKGEEAMQVVSGAFGHEKVHYEAPPSNCVASEMEHFLNWCNSAHHSPFIMAAVTHLWFVSIHPFDDGNGRISRTIADMFLSRLNDNSFRFYSMSAEINRNKKEYYSFLEQAQKGNLDITEWIVWFLNCLEKAINRALDTINSTLQKSIFWETHKLTPINERQRKVLNKLWENFEGKLSSSKWAKICHCSQDTALRDINDLIQKGILKNSGEGGRNSNYILVN